MTLIIKRLSKNIGSNLTRLSRFLSPHIVVQLFPWAPSINNVNFNGNPLFSLGPSILTLYPDARADRLADGRKGEGWVRNAPEGMTAQKDGAAGGWGVTG